MKLTVFWDAGCRLWAGVAEEESGGQLYAVRHVFGAEPGDAEVYDFVQRELPALLAAVRGVPASADEAALPKRVNPKRLARKVRDETAARRGVSTAAQDALKRELELRKRERAEVSKERREAERAEAYARRKRKAKEKHRGH